MRRAIAIAGLLLLVPALLAACGDGDAGLTRAEVETLVRAEVAAMRDEVESAGSVSNDEGSPSSQPSPARGEGVRAAVEQGLTRADVEAIVRAAIAAGSTTASTPIRPVDDSEAEGCETITMDMTMWPGEYRAIEARYTVAIQDDDMPSRPCVGGA